MTWWQSNQSQTPAPLGLPNNQQTMAASYPNGAMQPNGGMAPNPFAAMGAGMMGGMGYQYAPPPPMAPPSDLEVMAALMQTSVPMDRWFAGPNLQVLVSLMYKVSALATAEVLKNASLIETDDNKLKFEFIDPTLLPTPDSVTMENNSLATAAQASITQAQQQQQAILNMVQQNIMSDALNTAMANPGFMQSVGSTVGNVFRGALGLPSQQAPMPPVV